MKKKSIQLFFSLALLSTYAATAGAATYTWSSSATSRDWSTGANWDGGVSPPSSPANDIVFDNNAGMSSGYGVSFSTSQTIGSLTVDMSRLSIISTATRTLAIGNSSTAGRVTLTSALVEDSVLFTSGPTPRLNVEFANELILTNNGTGEAQIGNARIQNGAGATGTGTVRFTGSGNWKFLANSYLGKSISGGGGGNAVDVVLQGGTGDSFGGVVRYAATTAMDVAKLQVDGGTFLLESSSMNSSSGVFVGEQGTLAGSGNIVGNVVVDGKLVTGFDSSAATLNVDGNITLSNTAETTLRVFGGSGADSISGTGVLSLDGVLVLDVVAEEIAGIVLYSGFSAVTGDFSSVLIGSTALLQTAAGEWSGVANGYEWTFISETGLLSSVAVPEPATISLLLGAGALAVVGLRRRRASATAAA